MNKNVIIEEDFSNPESRRMYEMHWPNDHGLYKRYEDGEQCGGCSFFAPLNMDYGICCHSKSRHYKETVFEHFTCPVIINEGWGYHSFDEIIDKNS